MRQGLGHELFVDGPSDRGDREHLGVDVGEVVAHEAGRDGVGEVLRGGDAFASACSGCAGDVQGERRQPLAHDLERLATDASSS